MTFAADFNNWIGGARGEWNDSANWSMGVVPNKESWVRIENESSPVTILLTQDQDLGLMLVTNTPSVTFTGNAHNVKLNVHKDSKVTTYKEVEKNTYYGFFSPVTFESDVLVNFAAGKIWSISASMCFLGGFSTTLAATNLSVLDKEKGGILLSGVVTCPNGVNLSGPLMWQVSPESVIPKFYGTVVLFFLKMVLILLISIRFLVVNWPWLASTQFPFKTPQEMRLRSRLIKLGG